MTTFLELAKAGLRGGTDADADYALWNRTPFPFDTNPRLLFKRIDGYRRACANGRRLCDFCSNIVTGDEWCCKVCSAALTTVQHGGDR